MPVPSREQALFIHWTHLLDEKGLWKRRSRFGELVTPRKESKRSCKLQPASAFVHAPKEEKLEGVG